jgi:hypothetical protein
MSSGSDKTNRKIDSTNVPEYDNVNDNLTGFVKDRRGRQELSAVFVSGVILKNDSGKDTIACIYKHVAKRDCDVRGIWKIKQTGITMSVKMVVPRKQVDKIMTEGFWPNGINCREWFDRELES